MPYVHANWDFFLGTSGSALSQDHVAHTFVQSDVATLEYGFVEFRNAIDSPYPSEAVRADSVRAVVSGWPGMALKKIPGVAPFMFVCERGNDPEGAPRRGQVQWAACNPTPATFSIAVTFTVDYVDCPKTGCPSPPQGGPPVNYTRSQTRTITRVVLPGDPRRPTTTTTTRPNRRPIAHFTARVDPNDPLLYRFSSFAWDDDTADRPLLVRRWSFGGAEASPTHRFPGPGTYSVTLTVTDPGGLSATWTEVIVIGGGASS